MNVVKDIAERTFWTVAASFLGVLAASPVFDNLGLDWEDALKLALFTGAATLVKCLLAVATDRSSGGQLLPGPSSVEVKPDPPA
jgi:hypothetical protein